MRYIVSWPVCLFATGSISEPVARKDALDLANALSQELAGRLLQIRERYRRGERAAASEEIGQLLQHPHWAALDASLRGRILRTAALYRLVDASDSDTASKLAERASAEDPTGDGQVLAAQLAYRGEGATSALALLAEPSSPEALQLKAGILIEAGKPIEALTLLEGSAGVDEPEAGTFRLRALALLQLRRLPESEEAIDRAAALDADALALSTAGAVVDFWRACTPVALDLTDHPMAPMPFSSALVRVDDRAQGALERATERLSTAIEQMPEGSPEWVHWATWHLICLLAGDGSSQHASQLAGRILSVDAPVPLWALLWAVHYGVEFNRTAVKGQLRGVTQDQEGFVVHRGIWYELCLADGEEAPVLLDLPNVRDAFEADGDLDIWRQWYCLALTAAGRYDEARSKIDTIADDGLKLRLQLHIARAEPPEVAADQRLSVADALFSVVGNAGALLDACNAHAAEGDWEFVSEHAEALLAAIPTPTALRLLTSATWNRGEYRRCLTALDDHRRVFPGDLLPPDLAMLRVRCQRAIGDVSAAVRDARDAFEQSPTPQGLIELLDAQVQGGDLEGMRWSLRRMLGLDGVPGDDLLRAAALAGQSDRELGALLWRKATETGSDASDFAVQAAITGEALGLGDETAPWFHRMTELVESGTGGAMTLHISEMPDFIKAQRDGGERIEGLYRRGEVPVHLLPEGMFPPLSVLFHRIPESNRSDPDPLSQPPVLIRHGARPMQRLKRGERFQGKLILDITALLTAADLGLLDRVEVLRAPLYLTPNWHSLLLDEIRRLRPTQPDRLADQHRVAALVRANAIGLMDLAALDAPPADLIERVGERQARELAHARKAGGCLIDFLPLHGPDLADRKPVELPEKWDNWLAGPRALLDLALSKSLIDADTHTRACGLFGLQPPSCSELPERGGELLVSPGILVLLAQADVLPVIVQRFQLVMPADLWRQIEGELRQQKQDEYLAEWVQGLIDRVASGVTNGTYRILETQRPPGEKLEQPMHGLEDLLDYRGGPGDLIWIDDRSLNGYPATGTSWLIGTVEVLDLLRAAGAITRAERYEWLARLRASNHRFIPLEKQEILHWMSRTHSDSGRLVAPRQLEVLASYWSACLYQSDALQLTPTERYPHGELSFVHTSRTAINGALRSIWSDRRLNDRRKRQRADWVLNRLYVGLDDIQHLVPASDPNREANLPGLELGFLVLGAYTMIQGLPPSSEADLTPAERYLEWICDCVISPRLIADPRAVIPAAAVIRQSVAGFLADDRDSLSAQVAGAWTLRFLRIIPDLLRAELHKDQAMMASLGLAQVAVVQVDGLRLAARDLWAAVEGALRNAVPIVKDTEDGEPMTLRMVSPQDAPQPELELADAKGRPIGRHYFEHSEILSPSRVLRLRALQEHPQWWDGHPEGYEAVERLLSGIDASDARVHRLDGLAAGSADDFYLKLEARWRRQRGMELGELLPPGIDAILTYVRCPPPRETNSIDPARCWDALAQSIPPERGLAERLLRMALLPCLLPEAAHSEIRATGAADVHGLLDRLSVQLANPIGRLHLLDIVLSAAEALPDALSVAQTQIDYLTTTGFEADTRLLLALVDRAYCVLDGAEISMEHHPQARLLAAWVHSGRLAGILLATGADSEPLTEQLQHWAPFPHRDLYGGVGTPYQDLAWPWNGWIYIAF